MGWHGVNGSIMNESSGVGSGSSLDSLGCFLEAFDASRIKFRVPWPELKLRFVCIQLEEQFLYINNLRVNRNNAIHHVLCHELFCFAGSPVGLLLLGLRHACYFVKGPPIYQQCAELTINHTPGCFSVGTI